MFKDPEQEISLNSLPFQDPDSVVAGGIHNHLKSWEPIVGLQSPSVHQRVTRWLSNGVAVEEFFQPFKGTFKGKYFDLDCPPCRVFQNPASCAPYANMIAETLEERLRSGGLAIWGRVGEVEPPTLVLLFVVEPSKHVGCVMMHVSLICGSQTTLFALTL